MIVLCPFTGSIQSSLRVNADVTGKLPVGVSSVSMYPAFFHDALALSFGSSSKKDDSYALLTSLRPKNSLTPTLHWKCRLPETNMTAGLLVSDCGNYIVGGGSSGTVYVWKALGGALLSTFKAHYRAVSCMVWSGCGRFLVTGGADGIVHSFSLQSILATADNSDYQEANVQPIRSFSHHQLAVTSIRALPGGRMVSGAVDGQVCIYELFSEQLLASIQLPHPVTCMDITPHRIYIGTQQGTIHIVDIDQYALHQTRQQGAVVPGRNVRKESGESLFRIGREHNTVSTDGTTLDRSSLQQSYQAELSGHDRPVSAIAVLFDYDSEWIVSGDQAGTLRVWDASSRSCVRTIHVWSQQQNKLAAGSKTMAPQHSPISSITIMDEPKDSDMRSSVTSILSQGVDSQQSTRTNPRSQSKKHQQQSLIHELKPLQRFTDDASTFEHLTVRLKRPSRMFWHDAAPEESFDVIGAIRKRLKPGMDAIASGDKATAVDKDAEIERLKLELATARQISIEQQSG